MATKTVEGIRSELYDLDPYRFEHLVAKVWEAQGWRTEVKQESGDAGIDVVARRSAPVNETHVIQAKRYGPANNVTGPEIQQYASLRQQVDGASAVVVVTSSDFTDPGIARASELNVKLVDGDELAQMIERHGLEGELGTKRRQARGSSPTSGSADGFKLPEIRTKHLLSGTVLLQITGTVSLFQSYGFSVTIGAYLFGIAMLASPVVVFLDSVQLHLLDNDVNPNRLLWPLGCLMTGGLAILLYAYYRWSYWA